MGGVGKTQLAVEYAHRYGRGFQAVWWVDAENLTVATSGLIEFAAALTVPTHGTPASVLRRLWSALADRDDWLLIYDNVGDPIALSDVRPPERGRLLITSRSPAFSRLADLVEVGEFNRAESVALLVRRCPALSETQADQIAAAVGDLPLAVEQAGCFLADTSLHVTEYLHLIATQPAQAGLDDPTLDRHPGLVTIVTAGRVRLHAAGPAAAAVLDQLAFCAPEPLPLAPYRVSASQDEAAAWFGIRIGDTATTAAIVRYITRFGLARQTGASLQIHRLVQALLRARLSAADRRRVLHAAEELVATAILGDPNDPITWPAYAVISPHVQALAEHHDGDIASADTEPEQFRSLLFDVSRYLHASGRDATGRRLIEAARRRWTDDLGADHPDTLSAAYSLAVKLWSLGNQVAARVLDEDTLARRRRLFGDDHPDTLRSAHNLAADLRELGDLAAAHALDKDTLARRRRLFGDDDPSTLRSAHNLAVDLRELGDLAAARTLVEDVLARRRLVLGDDHPDTKKTLQQLAHLTPQQDDL